MENRKERCSECSWKGMTDDLRNAYPDQERSYDVLVCPDCNGIPVLHHNQIEEKELYIYCRCVKRGNGYITQISFDEIPLDKTRPNPIFPVGKVQKYKLIPVESGQPLIHNDLPPKSGIHRE